MNVEEYKGNINRLFDVIVSWNDTCKGSTFGIDISMDRFAEELQVLISNEDSVLFVLIDDTTKIVGIIGMIKFLNPVSNRMIANEHFWYVIPEYRGFHSMHLIRSAFAWAEDNNCSHMMLNASMLASDLHDKVCDLCMRLGMKKFETSFIKEI